MRQRRCQFPLAEMGPVLGVVLRKARLASGAADSARRYPALAQRTLFSSGSCRDHYDEQAPYDGPDHAADLRNHLRASRVANQREYGRQQGKPDFRANASPNHQRCEEWKDDEAERKFDQYHRFRLSCLTRWTGRDMHSLLQFIRRVERHGPQLASQSLSICFPDDAILGTDSRYVHDAGDPFTQVRRLG